MTMQEMQEQLRTLIERDHAKLMKQLADVVRLLTQTGEGSAVTQDAISQAESLTHQMKGAAGSIGFPEMGVAAAVLDETLKGLRRRGIPIPPVELEAALDLLAALQRVAARTAPERSALYNADLSRLAE